MAIIYSNGAKMVLLKNKWLRSFKITVIILLVSSLVYSCSGGLKISSRSMPKIKSGYAIQKNEPIGILDEGWHTGLIVPASVLTKQLNKLKQWFPKNTMYFVFGFGNRKYYMSQNPGLGSAIAALFPSKSVIRVQALFENPKEYFSNYAKIRWVCFSSSQLQRLDVYISDYLSESPKNRLVMLKKGLSGDSYFFASPGIYDAFYTCNTWTVNALHFSGLPINDRGVIFSYQVLSKINNLKLQKEINCKN